MPADSAERSPYNGCKTAKNLETKRTVVSKVEGVLPWLELGHFRDLCIANDDALDAVLCAVMARLVQQGEAEQIPSNTRRHRVPGGMDSRCPNYHPFSRESALEIDERSLTSCARARLIAPTSQ